MLATKLETSVTGLQDEQRTVLIQPQTASMASLAQAAWGEYARCRYWYCTDSCRLDSFQRRGQGNPKQTVDFRSRCRSIRGQSG